MEMIVNLKEHSYPIYIEKHIGIVSNYRNKKGITFVIHHAYPHQFYYEEDILEKRNDIIGHYRIS